MAQIPLYEQNAMPTTEIPSAMANVGSPVADAVSKLGGTVANIGSQFAEKMASEEAQAQTASFYADRKRRLNALNSSISTLTEPKEIESAYADWRKEEDKIFSEADLSNRARRAIGNNNEMFYADADISVADAANKARITKADNSWIDVMTMAEMGESDPAITDADGRALEPNELHAYAVDKRVALGKVTYEEGDKLKKEFPSISAYNKYLNDAELMEREYLAGRIGGQEYLDYLDQKSEEIRGDKDLLPKHGSPLETMYVSRGNNIYRKEATKAQRASNNWRKAQEEGTITPATNKILRDQMPDELYLDLVSTMKDSLVGKATTDEDARAIVNIMHERDMGNKSITEAFREIKDKGGDFAFQGILWLMQSVERDVQDGKEIQAFEVLYRDQKVETTGRMGDFISDLMPTLTDKSKASEINSLMRKASKVIDSNPEMSDEEWEKAKNDILIGNASKLMRNLQPPVMHGLGMVAPWDDGRKTDQPQETEYMPAPNSVEEYNNIPSGTRYLHPDGDIRVKK